LLILHCELVILYYEKNAPTFFKIKEATEFRNKNSDGKNISGPGNSATNSNSAFRRTDCKTQSDCIATAIQLHPEEKG
jgi:hypothetical protein